MRNTTLLFLFLIFIFSDCKKAEKTADNPNGINKTPFYKHLVGKIGDKNSTLNLTCNIEDNALGKTPMLTGYYYSNDDLEPHKISGMYDSIGGLKLTVWDNDDESAIYFDGKFINNETYSGVFCDTTLKSKLPFSLVENYTDALELAHNSLSDSLQLFKNMEGSPTATFGINLLIPKTSRKDVADFLIPQILKIPVSVSITDDMDGDKV